jgi:hypothetical protein
MNRAVLSILAALTLSANPAGRTAAEDDRSPQGDVGSPDCLPDIQASAGTPEVFATHSQLASYGFMWGPSDGNFGAIPQRGRTYKFYGTAGAASLCRPGNPCEGTFAFSGKLDRVTGGDPTKKLFGPGAGPAGWMFDRDYAGGGQIVRFDAKEGLAGWLMTFHGEYQWKNPANPPGYKCFVGTTQSQVACFYSGIGLAVSLDDGKTFKVVGQTMQPAQPLSIFTGSGKNMDVGYGSLIVADGHGRHLENPPPDPSAAYFYLFFSDKLPAGTPRSGVCVAGNCMGVARAKYQDVVGAALSGDPQRVATVFHKYDGGAPDPWTQPATGGTPDLSGTAGTFAPLWTDETAPEGSVIYDRSLDVYLAAYLHGAIHMRASRDLIHWTATIGVIPLPTTPPAMFFYPTVIGETGDPTIGGGSPRVYFSAFPVNAFPDYKQSTFEYVQVTLTGSGHEKHGCAGADR